MLIPTGITIDGTDITDYIAYQGVKWTRADIDGPSAGRTLSGLMIRDRVATKIRLDITCRPLLYPELQTLLNLIYPEFVTVEYDDPMLGLVTKTMYANNNGAQIYRLQKAHYSEQQWFMPGYKNPPMEEYWVGVTFPLVER